MAVSVKPLSDALGAEICGLDLSQELDFGNGRASQGRMAPASRAVVS